MHQKPGKINWIIILIYCILVFIGWASIYSSSYSPESSFDLINTKTIDRKIYGYNSSNIKSIIGFINAFNSFLTSSLFNKSKHCCIKVSLILSITEKIDFIFSLRTYHHTFLSNSINE